MVGNHLYKREVTSDFTLAEKKEIEQKVAFELHDAQCKMIKTGGIANVLGSLFIIWVLWSQVSARLLMSWYIAVFSINLVNVVLAFYYQSHSPSIQQIKSRLKIYHLILALLCLTLGSMGILFAPNDLPPQLFIVAFLLVILVCFGFGTITDFAASVTSIITLIIPTAIFRIYLAVSSVELQGFDSGLNLSAGISLIIAAIFILATCYIGNKLVKKSFQLVFANMMLSEKLENANQFLEHRVKKRTIELEKSLDLVKYQATHDLLTHLPNQRLLEEYIYTFIETSHNNRNMFAVFFFSLNEMDKINDGIGHEASYFIIQTIAKRLKKAFFEKTQGSLANFNYRLSLSRRDEFVLLLGPLVELETIETMAAPFFAILEEPVFVNGQAIKLTASIGVSLYPENGLDTKALLMNADAAMRNAKQWGGNKLYIYKAEINAGVSRQLEIESHLHNALKNNEFRVYYQPFVDLKTGHICGMEALLRWKNPKLGFISPADFIPLAEANGVILPLGEWVLRNACLQTKSWHLQGFNALKIAINLSARQLQQKDIIKLVADIIMETGISPEYVELELTETEAFKEESIPVIKQFKTMGLDLSIDDFGTGYSGLTNLKLFAIDKLKIDKSFVQDIENSDDSKNIVINTIELAKKMGITILAEGVETKGQLKFLWENGCDMIQGYYFSPPVTADTFTELLMNKQFLKDVS